MDTHDRVILTSFPLLLQTNYKPTSPHTISYNCIAWALGDDSKVWWPNSQYFWPDGILNEVSIKAFTSMFALYGYIECPSEKLEKGFEKIALYVDDQNFPTHASRQLRNGRWTSKLGGSKDIEHALNELTQSDYGKVVKIYKRPITSKK